MLSSFCSETKKSHQKKLYLHRQMLEKIFNEIAKQIIAINISDIPKILTYCGWIVEPENAK